MSNPFWLSEAQMARFEPFFFKAMASHALRIVASSAA